MRSALQAMAVLYGVAAAALGLLAGASLLLLSTGADGPDSLGLAAGPSPQQTELAIITMSVSVVATGIILGLGLSAAGWRSLQNWTSPGLRLPRFWQLLLAFLGLLMLGEVLRVTGLALFLLPFIHVVVSFLAPLALIGFVINHLRNAGTTITRRDLAWQLGYGTLVAAVLAGAVELIAMISMGAMAAILTAALPGGQASLEELSRQLQSPAVMQDPQVLLSTLLSPALWLAVLLVIAVLAPVIEEIAKSLGVVFAGMARKRLSRPQAFALGIMAGAGFSVAEALINGALQLPSAWAAVVLLRAGTAVIHCLATGLMALGWHALLVRRERGGFAALALASVVLHGAWNAVAGLLALSAASIQDAAGPLQPMSILAAVAVLFQGALFLMSLLALILLTRRLADEARAAQMLASTVS